MHARCRAAVAGARAQRGGVATLSSPLRQGRSCSGPGARASPSPPARVTAGRAPRAPRAHAIACRPRDSVFCGSGPAARLQIGQHRAPISRDSRAPPRHGRHGGRRWGAPAVGSLAAAGPGGARAARRGARTAPPPGQPTVPRRAPAPAGAFAFTPGVALVGGAVLGLAAGAKYLLTGRILGISGRRGGGSASRRRGPHAQLQVGRAAPRPHCWPHPVPAGVLKGWIAVGGRGQVVACHTAARQPAHASCSPRRRQPCTQPLLPSPLLPTPARCQGDWQPWRAAFSGGFLAASAAVGAAAPGAFDALPASYMPARAAAGGLLVGLGAAVGNGCTSGHGICGNARLSARCGRRALGRLRGSRRGASGARAVAVTGANARRVQPCTFFNAHGPPPPHVPPEAPWPTPSPSWRPALRPRRSRAPPPRSACHPRRRRWHGPPRRARSAAAAACLRRPPQPSARSRLRLRGGGGAAARRGRRGSSWRQRRPAGRCLRRASPTREWSALPR
jgi:uncharacterized membrane protein YedE/YeeE